MLVVKMRCKECYLKKHETITVSDDEHVYQITKEKCKCEDCGKMDFLIHDTEPYTGKGYDIVEEYLKFSKNKKDNIVHLR